MIVLHEKEASVSRLVDGSFRMKMGSVPPAPKDLIVTDSGTVRLAFFFIHLSAIA